MAQRLEVDIELCARYAAFMSRLDRKHFDATYWTLFFFVLLSLFISSWVYQRTMRFKDKPDVDAAAYRRKLKTSLAVCTAVFLVTAVFCVVEVYALLALQFCDGENLMSLFWSTWTMLQLGSEMAILGIVLALWHSIVEIRHPMWALALGTPVLVVAGFGHVIQHFCELCWKRAKHRRKNSIKNRRYQRQGSSSGSGGSSQSIDCEKGEGEEEPASSSISSSATSVKPEQEQIEEARQTQTTATRTTPTNSIRPMISALDSQQTAKGNVYLAIDVGGDDARVRTWPAFMGMSADGKAVLQLTRTPAPPRGDGDLESGNIGPSPQPQSPPPSPPPRCPSITISPRPKRS